LSVKGYASDDMEHNYSRAKDLSQGIAGCVQEFRATWGLWVFHLVRGQLATARDLAENLLALASRKQSSDLLIEAHRNLGTTYFCLGRFNEAKTHLLTATSLYDPTQHRTHAFLYGQDPGIAARLHLARTLWILGEVEQVEPLALEAIGRAKELEHPFTRVYTLCLLSWLYSTIRNAQRTLDLTGEAIALSTQYGFKLGLAWSTTFHGWALAEQGREDGLGMFINGLSATRVTGANINNTLSLALLAELYLRKTRIDEGLGAIEEAQKLAIPDGELFWQAELLRLKGELLLGQSDQSDELVHAAEQCLCDALKIAQDQHATMLELRAATSLARFWKTRHKVDEATRILNAVCVKFHEGVDDRELIEAKTVLAQLRV
jgi:predicted ATPase